jgi:hypothetical protein
LAELFQGNTYPFSAVYTNPSTSAGKKFILLLACSILKVYNGVSDGEYRAVTAVIARKAIITAVAVSATLCILFIIFTSFEFEFSFDHPVQPSLLKSLLVVTITYGF